MEARLGVAEHLAACIDDPRTPDCIQHSLAAMLRFRPLMIAAAYEDGNDACSLLGSAARPASALPQPRCAPTQRVTHSGTAATLF